jgi:hypothetical protein
VIFCDEWERLTVQTANCRHGCFQEVALPILPCTPRISIRSSVYRQLIVANGTAGKPPPCRSSRMVSLKTLEPAIQGSDGSFYGLAVPNNGFNPGVAYKISKTGALSTLYTFTDPTQTVANGLALASNGNFYGSTHNTRTECRGTIFELTPAGKLTTLITSTGAGVVCSPTTLMEASDGNLYGVDTQGAFGHGAIFRLTLQGALVPLHSFAADGSEGIYAQTFGPTLVQASDGKLYGTTGSGGQAGLTGGTVYRLDLGLPKPLPRVANFSPSSGQVGSSILISGSNLIGVLKVSFHGTPAVQFASRGSNYVVANVPSGATSGPIMVTTPNGSAVSNANFTVQ